MIDDGEKKNQNFSHQVEHDTEWNLCATCILINMNTRKKNRIPKSIEKYELSCCRVQIKTELIVFELLLFLCQSRPRISLPFRPSIYDSTRITMRTAHVPFLFFWCVVMNGPLIVAVVRSAKNVLLFSPPVVNCLACEVNHVSICNLNDISRRAIKRTKTYISACSCVWCECVFRGVYERKNKHFV